MMKYSYFFLAVLLFVISAPVLAGDVEFVSTGEGQTSGSDAVIADDPYKGSDVPDSAYAGSKKTQKSYDEECKDDLCERAEKRQTSEGTTWKDDVKSGLHKGYGTSGTEAEAPTEKTE